MDSKDRRLQRLEPTLRHFEVGATRAVPVSAGQRATCGESLVLNVLREVTGSIL